MRLEYIVIYLVLCFIHYGFYKAWMIYQANLYQFRILSDGEIGCFIASFMFPITFIFTLDFSMYTRGWKLFKS